MGVVYIAHDNQLDRAVALKILYRQSDDRGAAAIEEARALARVRHPNVVTVFDAAPHGGRLCIVMEYVDGTTLRSWLGSGSRNWRRILELFVDAGRGLAAAHAAGIAHGDFKPDNVLVSHDGRVQVTDFGLARPARAVAGETSPLIGTPAYMAPEQLDGARADARTDQFAFCVALYEALLGRRPFVADDVGELRRQIRRGTPSDRRLPGAVARALGRGLQPDPQARHPSMDALLAALESWPRHRQVAGGSIALLALSLLVVRAFRHEKAPQNRVCRIDARQAGAALTEQRRVARAALAAAGGVRTLDSTDAALEAYVRRWVAARVGACEDADARAETDPVAHARYQERLRCFDNLRRRTELALVPGLSRTDWIRSSRRPAVARDLPRALSRFFLCDFVPPAPSSPRGLRMDIATRLERARMLILFAAAGCGGTGGPSRATTINACAPQPPPAAACQQARCGNGVIDYCPELDIKEGSTEGCDGNQLGGATCASQGYSGGSLSCGPTCELDRRACDSCSADARVTACGHLPAAAPTVSRLSIATNESEIAVAWAEVENDDSWHFTRFRPDTTMISDTACLGGGIWGLSLIAMPTGWLAASVDGMGTLQLTRLDPNGIVLWTEPVAPAMAPLQGVLGAIFPQLMSRPKGTPWLGWKGPETAQDWPAPVNLQPLDADGMPAGDQVTIQDVEDWAGVGVDDGIVLAAHVAPSTAQVAVQVFHLSPDGTLALATSIDAAPDYGYDGVSLAWTGSEARMIYGSQLLSPSGIEPAAFLQRVTNDGALIGDPRVVGILALGSYPLFAVGTDTVVLHNGLMQNGRLDRWTDDGATTPTFQLQAVQLPYVTEIGLAEQGGDAILAWGNDEIPLSLERVRINP